jgi:RNA polymerase sigma factor (sigma-70 family)
MELDIIKFNQKDEAQFSILFKTYHLPILYFVKKMLAPEDDVIAEDIATETFVKAWKDAAKFVSEENIRAFLYLVAKNGALTHLQGKKRKELSHREIIYLTSEAQEDRQPATRLDDMEMINADIIGYLRKELQKSLSKQDHVLLRYVEGLKTKEIADELKITEKSVLNMKLSAAKNMREKIQRLISRGGKPEVENGILKWEPSEILVPIVTEVEIPILQALVKEESLKHVSPQETNTRRKRGRGRVKSSLRDKVQLPEHIIYMSYREARTYVQQVLVPMNIDSTSRISTFMTSKHPLIDIHMPMYPDKHYRKTREWKGERDFFGEEVFMKKWMKKGYLPYKQAREWVINTLVPMGIDSQSKFYEYIHGKDGAGKRELPPGIPRAPVDVYSKIGVWEGWPQYFGRKNVYQDGRKKFAPLEKVKEFIMMHDPFGRITWKRWQNWVHGKDKALPEPTFPVPLRPEDQYEDWPGYEYVNLFTEYKR